MSDYYRINYLIFIKPNLPDLGLRRLLFLKLTLMVRLETAPTGPEDCVLEQFCELVFFSIGSNAF